MEKVHWQAKVGVGNACRMKHSYCKLEDNIYVVSWSFRRTWSMMACYWLYFNSIMVRYMKNFHLHLVTNVQRWQ